MNSARKRARFLREAVKIVARLSGWEVRIIGGDPRTYIHERASLLPLRCLPRPVKYSCRCRLTGERFSNSVAEIPLEKLCSSLSLFFFLPLACRAPLNLSFDLFFLFDFIDLPVGPPICELRNRTTFCYRQSYDKSLEVYSSWNLFRYSFARWSLSLFTFACLFVVENFRYYCFYSYYGWNTMVIKMYCDFLHTFLAFFL